MAACTSQAERARGSWRIGAALLALAVLLGGCELFQPGEPRASRDVLDALYAGMKRAQDNPTEPAPEPRATPHGSSQDDRRGPRERGTP
jgi:hypothetical protein